MSTTDRRREILDALASSPVPEIREIADAIRSGSESWQSIAENSGYSEVIHQGLDALRTMDLHRAPEQPADVPEPVDDDEYFETNTVLRRR